MAIAGNDTTCLLLEDDLESYADLVDNKEDDGVNNYTRSIRAMVSHARNGTTTTTAQLAGGGSEAPDPRPPATADNEPAREKPRRPRPRRRRREKGKGFPSQLTQPVESDQTETEGNRGRGACALLPGPSAAPKRPRVSEARAVDKPRALAGQGGSVSTASTLALSLVQAVAQEQGFALDMFQELEIAGVTLRATVQAAQLVAMRR